MHWDSCQTKWGGHWQSGLHGLRHISLSVSFRLVQVLLQGLEHWLKIIPGGHVTVGSGWVEEWELTFFTLCRASFLGEGITVTELETEGDPQTERVFSSLTFKPSSLHWLIYDRTEGQKQFLPSHLQTWETHSLSGEDNRRAGEGTKRQMSC